MLTGISFILFIVPLLAILISTAVLHGIIKSTKLLNIIEGILLGMLALYILYLK